MKKISILGATGSIGRQTLDVIEEFNNKFEVHALTSGRNIPLFKEQLKKFKPAVAAIQFESDRLEVQAFITEHHLDTRLIWGEKGLEEIAEDQSCDLLVVAIVGTAAIYPVYKAIENGIPIALACKEILVSAGDLIMPLAKKNNVPILPIDSEHAAIKQCLACVSENIDQVEKIIITASGGSLRKFSLEALQSVTVEQALQHPNWSMGHKITIDSATLMNKALEVIEAHHLFQISFNKIEVVIHPQSIVHSAIECIDGNFIAQMGLPDMRFPIQYALSYPEKYPNPWGKMTLSQLTSLEFYPPDHQRFPLLSFAIDCGKRGGTWPVVLNAANEELVAQFLSKKINFSKLTQAIIDTTLAFDHFKNPRIEEIIAIDQQVKESLRHGH